MSKVTPKIVGVLFKGIWAESIWTLGAMLDSRLLSGVKRVTEDLFGAIERPFEDAQSEMDARCSFKWASDWGMDGEELRESRSSAKEKDIVFGC